MVTVIEEPEKLVKEKGYHIAATEYKKTKPFLLVDRGLQRESRIELYVVYFESGLQASAFIYSATFHLTSSHIKLMDSRFNEVEKRVISREFKDRGIEELNAAFLREAKPLIPFMSHDYTIHNPRVLEHSFAARAEIYLEDVIKELKE